METTAYFFREVVELNAEHLIREVSREVALERSDDSVDHQRLLNESNAEVTR